jgi:hypothetical protein
LHEYLVQDIHGLCSENTAVTRPEKLFKPTILTLFSQKLGKNAGVLVILTKL